MVYLTASIISILVFQLYVLIYVFVAITRAERTISRLDTLRIKVHATLRFLSELNAGRLQDALQYVVEEEECQCWIDPESGKKEYCPYCVAKEALEATGTSNLSDAAAEACRLLQDYREGK